MGFSPGSGVVSLRSNNRNFAGRSGTVGDQVYLASPEVLCVSALKGCISDPRELQMDYPRIDQPKKFLIDDRMIIDPPADGSEVEILRAETIGQPPKLDALLDELKGQVLLKLGDKITTDHISPAGQHLKWRSNIAEYAKVAFEAFNEEAQPSFAERAMKLKEDGKCGFIVAGKSYGQGSSREHAAICPRYLGVRMVIAENFERIHSDNLINWGIIPALLADASDGEKFAPDDELAIEAVRSAVKDAKQMTLRNVTKGCEITLALKLTARQRKILLAGGRLNYSE